MYKLELFEIGPEDLESVLQEQAGQGGFQVLLDKIKKQYSEQEKTLILYQQDIERLYRYTGDYGCGGFQNRISPLLNKIDLVIKDLMQYRSN